MAYNTPSIPGPKTAPLCKMCGHFNRDYESNCAFPDNVMPDMIDVIDGGRIYRNLIHYVRNIDSFCGIKGNWFITRAALEVALGVAARAKTVGNKPSIDEL